MNLAWQPHRLIGALVLGLAAVAPSVLCAEPPSILSMFHRKLSLADESLVLKPEHGPWLILAATLPGTDAKAQATELAREIRSSLNLPSFVMEKASGVATTLATRERIKTDDAGNVIPYDLAVRYANGGQERMFVVLVGEFTSIDDPRIPDALQAVKRAHPASLSAAQGAAEQANGETGGNSWLLQKYRSMMWTRSDRKEGFGPMGAAFVTRNPLLPDDYFEAPKVDDFVADLNKNVEHSLLQCPGKFTVRVASFTGRQVTDFGNGSRASKLSETTDELDQAAWKAHKLTAALRREGEEAYEFHDRFGSYVMIGSFDRLGQELAAGQFQYNPGIVALLQKWCGYRTVDTRDPVTGAMGKVTSLKSLEKIPFDIEGKPMAVPRAETSKLYRGSLLGGR
ncbi:MAG: hypothetical protein KDA45_09695 [Planctomycetales bacterium]|nr:hypothetical protein [Planctomycetales bacterium]